MNHKMFINLCNDSIKLISSVITIFLGVSIYYIHSHTEFTYQGKIDHLCQSAKCPHFKWCTT